MTVLEEKFIGLGIVRDIIQMPLQNELVMGMVAKIVTDIVDGTDVDAVRNSVQELRRWHNNLSHYTFRDMLDVSNKTPSPEPVPEPVETPEGEADAIPEAMGFREGDVVCLRSGGPPMAIGLIYMDEGLAVADCVWWDWAGGHVRNGRVPVSCLKKMW